MGFHEGSIRESTGSIAVQRLGLVDYRYAWEKQQELAAARAADEIEDTLLIVEHPSTYTAGKRTQPSDLPHNQAPVIPVDRGGRITWHGPGQLVIYPIIKLADPLDVVDYVRRIEEAILRTCQSQGLDSVGRVEGRSGVWLPADSFDSPEDSAGTLRGLHTLRVLRPARKIAAIGIRITKKVTMHGLALNCNNTLEYYHNIVPCGLPDTGVTSLSQELGKDISPEDVEDTLISFLIDSFQGELPLSDLTIPEELAHEALMSDSSS